MVHAVGARHSRPRSGSGGRRSITERRPDRHAGVPSASCAWPRVRSRVSHWQGMARPRRSARAALDLDRPICVKGANRDPHGVWHDLRPCARPTSHSMSPIDQQQESRQRDRLRQLVERLTGEQLATPLGGDWTVGVAFAHMAFWDRRVVAQLAKWAREGRGPEPRDTIDSEVINEASLAQWRALEPRAAANEALAAAEAADQALARTD